MSRWQRFKPWGPARTAVTLSGEPVSLAGVPRGAVLSVSVADALSRGWVTTPPAGLTDFQELRAVAEARFEAVFHTSPAEWRIEADWSAERPFVCSALPLSFLNALHAEAQAQGLRLHSIAPQWVRALQRLPLRQIAREPLALACAVSAHSVAALILREGVPIDWRQHWCAPTEAAQHLRGQALAAGCELPPQAWAVGSANALAALAQGSAPLRWKAVPA